MKRILIGLTMMLCGGVGFYFVTQQKPVEYKAVPEVQAPQQVIKQEDMLQARIKQAQEAKKGEIEIEAQKAKDAAISQALLEIELEVTTAYRKEIEAKEKELQAQSVAY